MKLLRELNEAANEWHETTVFGSDRDGGEEEFEIEFRLANGKLAEVKWPDEADFQPEREVYWDEKDVTKQIEDAIDNKEYK